MARKQTAFQNIDDLKKRPEFEKKLGLDERDNTILSMIQKDPSISQEEIGKKIKLSQPSVGARLKKLQEKGVLQNTNGVNFKTVDLHLAKIDVNATDTSAIIKEFRDCPFFINALVTSGRYNLCLFFTATDLKRLEGIVNHHLRGNPMVKDLELNIVITTAKDFIMPLSFDPDNKKQSACGMDCAHCI